VIGRKPGTKSLISEISMRQKREMIGKPGEVYLPNDCSGLGCAGAGGALDKKAGTERTRNQGNMQVSSSSTQFEINVEGLSVQFHIVLLP